MGEGSVAAPEKDSGVPKRSFSTALHSSSMGESLLPDCVSTIELVQSLRCQKKAPASEKQTQGSTLSRDLCVENIPGMGFKGGSISDHRDAGQEPYARPGSMQRIVLEQRPDHGECIDGDVDVNGTASVWYDSRFQAADDLDLAA